MSQAFGQAILLTTLLYVFDDLAMDSREATVLTFFDLSEAFDCVNRSLLFLKLKEILMSYQYITWIKSHSSDWKAVMSGDPQTSVLGPSLFRIYIVDVSTRLK